MIKIFVKYLLAGIVFISIAGCGINVGDVRSVKGTTASSEDKGIVVGKVKFIVDGKQMQYNFLNHPIMRLYRLNDQKYYETPQADSSGDYSWELPAGDYEIAVLFGGMSPTGRAMFYRNRPGYMVVNGFTYPGLAFSVKAKQKIYLGTLQVDVNSRKTKALIDFGERVFESLNGMDIIDESQNDSNWQKVKDLSNSEIQLLRRLK